MPSATCRHCARAQARTVNDAARWLALAFVVLAMCLSGCSRGSPSPAPAQPPTTQSVAATAGAACAAVVAKGQWGELGPGVSVRVTGSELTTSAAQLASHGITQSTAAEPWIVVHIEVANKGRGRLDPASLGLRLIYPGMLLDDPDDSDSPGPPSTLVGAGGRDFGAAGATSTLTMAFLVPSAASPNASSLKTTTASGCDEYFRLR